MPQQYFRPLIPGLQICDTISVFGVLFPTFYLCFPTFGFGLLISDFRLWIPYILFWSSEFLFRTIHFRLQSSDFGHSISEFGLFFSTFDFPFFGILISNLYLGFRTRNLNSDHWRIIFYLPAWHFSWNDDLRVLSLLRLICDDYSTVIHQLLHVHFEVLLLVFLFSNFDSEVPFSTSIMLEGPTSFLSQVYEINFDGISIVIFKLTSLRRLNLLNLNSYRHLNSPPNTTRDQGNDLKTQWNEMVLIVKQILLVSTIGDKRRTVCRTCSHFRLSRGKQIRQQFANSREKRGFFYYYFLDN